MTRREDAAKAAPESTWPVLAGISDDAVKKKTDKSWVEWVRWLDAENATSLTHPQIAKLILARFPEVGGWWSQGITVAYERIRGLREVGQRRDTKAFDANKSKTFHVHVSRLYTAFSRKRERAKWLKVERSVRVPRKDKSMRVDWADGTKVAVHFWDKGASKSSVSIQHSGHTTKKKADAAKVFWHERLQELALVLS
ncbi:MAG: hypothetical protein AB8H86_33410 [Polyangiales bacterium]